MNSFGLSRTVCVATTTCPGQTRRQLGRRLSPSAANASAARARSQLRTLEGLIQLGSVLDCVSRGIRRLVDARRHAGSNWSPTHSRSRLSGGAGNWFFPPLRRGFAVPLSRQPRFARRAQQGFTEGICLSIHCAEPATRTRRACLVRAANDRPDGRWARERRRR